MPSNIDDNITPSSSELGFGAETKIGSEGKCPSTNHGITLLLLLAPRQISTFIIAVSANFSDPRHGVPIHTSSSVFPCFFAFIRGNSTVTYFLPSAPVRRETMCNSHGSVYHPPIPVPTAESCICGIQPTPEVYHVS